MVKFVGDYELLEVLGQGSFATVRKARHKVTGLYYACKIINKNKIIEQNLFDNLKQEVNVLKMLHHPNISELYEIFETSQYIFLVLEIVDGQELADQIREKGKFNEQEARYYFQQLINAVYYCGQNHVVHRDLKPENILIDKKLNLKVSDFGLAGIFKVGENKLMKTTCGTLCYVAPEILQSNRGYDGHIADVWSCGVILFQMLTGTLPF